MSGHQRILACCLLSFAVGCQADGTGFKNPFSRAERSVADAKDSSMKLPEFKRRKAEDLKTLDRDKPMIASEQLERLLQDGQNALQQRELDQAKTSYEEVLEYEPDNATAHHGLAMAADLEGKYADAELHYKKALHVRPRDANLLSDIGYSYVLQNRYDEAARYLNQAIEVNPQHEYAHLNLALLDLKQGKKAAAEQRLVKLYGQSGQVVQTLAQLQEQAGLPVDTAVAQNNPATVDPDLPPNASFEQVQELANRRRQEAERQRTVQGIPVAGGSMTGIPGAGQQPVIPAGFPQPGTEAAGPIQVAPGPQWPTAQSMNGAAAGAGMAMNGMNSAGTGINTQSGISIQPGTFGPPGQGSTGSAPVAAPAPAGNGMPVSGQPTAQNWPGAMPSGAGSTVASGAPSGAASGTNSGFGGNAIPGQWPPSSPGMNAASYPPTSGVGLNVTAMNPGFASGVPGENRTATGAGMPAGWNTAPMNANSGLNPINNPASGMAATNGTATNGMATSSVAANGMGAVANPGMAANSQGGLVPIHSTGAYSSPAATPISYGMPNVQSAPAAVQGQGGRAGGLRLEGLNVGPGSLFPVGMGEPTTGQAPSANGMPANGVPAGGMMGPGSMMPNMGPSSAINGMPGTNGQTPGTAADVRMGNLASPGTGSMVNGAMYGQPTSVLPAQEWMNQMNAAKAAAAGQGSAAQAPPGVSAPWPAARQMQASGLEAFERQRQQLDNQYNNTLQQMNRQFPSSAEAKY